MLLETLTRDVGPDPGRAHRHKLDGVGIERLLGRLNERVRVVDLRLRGETSKEDEGKGTRLGIKINKFTHDW